MKKIIFGIIFSLAVVITISSVSFAEETMTNTMPGGSNMTMGEQGSVVGSPRPLKPLPPIPQLSASPRPLPSGSPLPSPLNDGNGVMMKSDIRVFQTMTPEMEQKMMETRQKNVEQLKQALDKKVKDEKKKEAVQRVDKSIDTLNKKMTRELNDALNRLTKTLDQISKRVARMEGKKDMTAARAAIDNANDAISEAYAAVQVQAAKSYSITVTSESKLKQDVQTSRKALETDLKAVRDLAQAAKKAVQDAAIATAQGEQKKIVPPSPLPTPSDTPVSSPVATPNN